jgi:hypothetical protein
MLAPIRPRADDPHFAEQQRRYERDREDLRKHPENWGAPQPVGTPGSPNAATANGTPPRGSERNSREHGRR